MSHSPPPPLFKQREWLREVADADLILGVQFRVLALEVEPLLMAFSVGIHLAKEVVFLDHGLAIFSLLLDVLETDRLSFGSLEIAAFDC